MAQLQEEQFFDSIRQQQVDAFTEYLENNAYTQVLTPMGAQNALHLLAAARWEEAESLQAAITLFREREMSAYPRPGVWAINQVDEQGDTPLIIAAKKGNIAALVAMINNLSEENVAIANVTKKDKQGRTAMHYLAEHGFVGLFSRILDAQFQIVNLDAEDEIDKAIQAINDVDNQGRSYLMSAAAAGRSQVASYIMGHQDVLFYTEDTLSNNFLHHACSEYQPGSDEWERLEKKNTQSGKRAIITEFFNYSPQNKDMFYQLLATKNKADQTPLSLAYLNSGDDDLKLLLEQKIQAHFEALSNSLKPKVDQADSQLRLWMKKLMSEFEVGSNNPEVWRKNDSLQRLLQHTAVLIKELAAEQQQALALKGDEGAVRLGKQALSSHMQVAIAKWEKHTKEDCYDQLVLDRWTMLKVSLVLMVLFSLVGFASTYLAYKVPAWQAMQTYKAVEQAGFWANTSARVTEMASIARADIWVANSAQAWIVGLVTGASALSGIVSGVVYSKLCFFQEPKCIANVVSEEHQNIEQLLPGTMNS